MNKSAATLLSRFYGRFMNDRDGYKYDDAKAAWSKMSRGAKASARRQMGSLLKEVERTADIRPGHRPRILAAIQPLIPPVVPMPRIAQKRLAISDKRRRRRESRARTRAAAAAEGQEDGE